MHNRKSSRRDFIKYSLSAIFALNFGCSIKGLLGDGQHKTAIIYGTKYGATRDTAVWIKNGIGHNVDLLDVETLDFEKAVSAYNYFIVGSGIWIDGVHRRLKDFLSSESVNLHKKVIAAFVVCGSQDTTDGGRKRIKRYLNQIHKPLGYKPELSSHFGGRVIVEQLTEKDREALTKFYRKFLKQELKSWDRTNEKKAVSFGKELQHLVEAYSVNV
jgi:menaquinone-dependent protoporphyrinogen oxidase